MCMQVQVHCPEAISNNVAEIYLMCSSSVSALSSGSSIWKQDDPRSCPWWDVADDLDLLMGSLCSIQLCVCECASGPADRACKMHVCSCVATNYSVTRA